MQCWPLTTVFNSTVVFMLFPCSLCSPCCFSPNLLSIQNPTKQRVVSCDFLTDMFFRPWLYHINFLVRCLSHWGLLQSTNWCAALNFHLLSVSVVFESKAVILMLFTFLTCAAAAAGGQALPERRTDPICRKWQVGTKNTTSCRIQWVEWDKPYISMTRYHVGFEYYNIVVYIS